MSYPADLIYTKSHEWAKVEGEEAIVGISQFAQEALGDVTYVDLPTVGSTVTAESEFGSIESVKAASDLISPVSGEVVAVNEALIDNPEMVNQAPYADGWMIRVKLSAPAKGLSAAEYEQICAEEAH